MKPLHCELIGFGDADSFYVSAESVRRPWLATVPAAVLGNQGACVIARNAPMKRAGVKVGMPIWEAKVKCPDAVFVKRDFQWYEVKSRQMLAVVREHTDAAEYSSIDEFFWKGYRLPGMTFLETARAIRDQVKEDTGLPMTVAFGRSRTLAKLLAETSKPFGAIAVEDEQHERELLARLPVTEIPGIGGRRGQKLAAYGIRTCLDFARASGKLVKMLLTKTGYELWLEINGERVTPIRPTRPRHKNLARGGSLAGRVGDRDVVFGWLTRNVERLVEVLELHEVRPAVLTVLLAYHELGGVGAKVRLDVPSARFSVLLDAAKIGLARAWMPGRVATHLHVVASELKQSSFWQQSLFDPADERLDALARVKAEVNQRHGRFRLRSGATLYANDFYKDPSNALEVCDIAGKFHF